MTFCTVLASWGSVRVACSAVKVMYCGVQYRKGEVGHSFVAVW